MAIIQKRADQLKPGDVIIRNENFGPAMVCTVKSASAPCRLEVRHFSLVHEDLDRSYYSPDQNVDVESPDLTPAQQHADELAAWVEKFKRCADDTMATHDYLSRGEYEKMTALLDKIKPPEPPTLAEALAALDEITRAAPLLAGLNDQRPLVQHCAGILDRARRAGLL